MKNLETNKTPRTFGTLYHHTMKKEHGSVVITPKPLTKKARITRTVGAGMTSVAMALYIHSFAPLIHNPVSPEPQIQQTVSAQQSDMTNASPADTSFSVYIPYLHTKSPVFENVDPSDEKAYGDILKDGVAQAQGTGVPGEGKRIFLFAHSTNSVLNIERYNALFYDLGKVPNGETIELYYHGTVYQYRVTGQRIVSADDVSWLSPKDGEELILQTCWPPGTSWKRLLLFATPL